MDCGWTHNSGTRMPLLAEEYVISHIPCICVINSWSREAVTKLLSSKNFTPFVDLEGSLPFSQRFTIGLCPELDESNPHSQTLFP
jgi:hypothetical protein